MKSIKKQTTRHAGWDFRFGSLNPARRRLAKRQRAHKLRQSQKQQLINMSEICVSCGASLGDAELGTMLCPDCTCKDSIS